MILNSISHIWYVHIIYSIYGHFIIQFFPFITVSFLSSKNFWILIFLMLILSFIYSTAHPSPVTTQLSFTATKITASTQTISSHVYFLQIHDAYNTPHQENIISSPSLITNLFTYLHADSSFASNPQIANSSYDSM